MHSSETTLSVARRSRIGSRAIAILSTLAVVFGLSIVAPLAASADPLTGTITGTVTSSETGLPISGLVVQVYSDSYDQNPTTNAAGVYEAAGLPPGQYSVYFAGPDLNYVEQYWQSSQTNAGKTLVTATAGTVTSGIDAAMTPGATISGRVVQAVNPSVGIQNVQVSANEDEYGPGEAHTYTDAAGNYTLKGVSPGSYRVWFYGNGVDYADKIWQDAYTYQTATLLDVPAQASITGIDAALTVEAVVSGRVVNSADPTEGIEGVWVQLSDALGPVRGGQTDASGYYTIDALPEGTFTVQFQGNTAGYMNEYWENATSLSEATPLTLVAGAVVAGIDGSLDAAAAISGTVTAESSAAPLAGIWVYANREGGGGSGSATTDVDGNYFIGGLASGDYRVNFNPNTQNYLDEYWDDEASFDDATLIHLDAEAHAQNIDAALAAGSTISGNVKGDDGVTPTNLAGVQVYATTDWTVSQPSGSGYATTDAAGNFTINGLTAGEYQLEFDASSTGTEFAPAIRSELVTVGSDQDITGIQMTLGLGGRITGTVSGVDAPTVGLQGIEVRIQDEGSAIYDYRSVYTGPDGTYSSAPLAPGTYRVTTALRWDSSLNYLGDTALVTVSGPGNVVRNWQLASGGKISGTVTGPGGVPQAGAQVEATNGNTSAWATTDSLGTYTIERLVTGPYTVSFQGGDSLATEWWQDSSSPGSATPVDVVAGGEVSGIDAELGQGSTISGTLLDGDGATVWAQAAVWDAATGIRVPIGFAIDEDGSYLISGLPVGSFKVGFSDRNSGDATDEYDDSGDLFGYHYQAAYLTGKTTKATADPITITAAGQALTGHNVTFVEVDQLKQFTVSPTPTISGALVEGRTLTATLGNWVPAVSHPQYRWLRDGVAIPFATTATYQLRAADVGHRISVTVTGSLIGYDASVTTSAETEPVVASGATVPVPTISGEARVGSTLLAHPGTWGPGSVDLAYQWTRNGVAIPGATSVDYELTADDLGALIAVVFSGSADGVHIADSISLVTAAIAEGAMTPGTVVIDGMPQVGLELTVDEGTWDPADVEFGYVWKSNGAVIVGATEPSYTPTADQEGKTIVVVVTGTKAGYVDATVTSFGVTIAPSGIVAGTPSIAGTPVVDGVLTVAPGTWGPPGVVLSYQWAVGGVDVVAATGASYTPAAADVGSVVTVAVTGTLAPRTPVTATSSATVPVAKAEFTTAAPTIDGVAKVGETLTATVPAWTPEATALSYSWMANGSPIGTDSAILVLTAAEAGATIAVKATGTREGYVTASASSLGTSEVANGDLVAGTVSLSGTAQVGETLTVDPGIWSPVEASLTYQWAVDGTDVAGAIGSTYTIPATAVDKPVTVLVTGTLAGYATASESAATASVSPGELTVTAPTISGTGAVGETLTATLPAWGPPPVDLSFRWLANGATIASETGLTLVLKSAQAGKTITFQVTGDKPGYASETVDSNVIIVAAASEPFFADVGPAHSFFIEIEWMAAEGISTGYPQGAGEKPLYKTTSDVSRQAMASFLYRLSGDVFSPPAEPTFADVPTTATFYKEIEWMAAEGISTGTEQGDGLKPLFKPSAAVSRQAMSAFLYRYEGSTVAGPSASPFVDVPTTSTFYDEIAWMYSSGISTGYENETGLPSYRSTANVSRQAMAAFLYRIDHN